eukprot:1699768-Pyramimonas_sp.AAC.1
MMVTGNHSTNPAPPLRTVQFDSRYVVGAEAHGRLHLTKLPLPPFNPLHKRTQPSISTAGEFTSAAGEFTSATLNSPQPP